MSIVLEALEKAQRQGEVVPPARIETELQKPELKIRPLPRPKSAYKRIWVFSSIFIIAIINIVSLNWWLNRNNSSITVDISHVSKIPLPKIIPSNPPRQTPPVNVTGVVWDQKEPIALVNGKFLKKGDEILGAKIIDIQLNEVRFLYKDEEFTISVE